MVNRWTGGFDAALELAPAGADRILAALHRKGDPLPDLPGTGPHLLHSFALNLPLAGATPERDLRGHLQVQVSTPSVSVPTGGDGRVSVSVVLYAWFQKTFQSDPAPPFVHGTLSFTTGVEVLECRGSTLAEVRVNASEVAVSFEAAAGSGLAPADAALVEEVARDFLRSSLRPVQMRIQGLEAGDFRVEHVAFETLSSGSRAALAVGLGFRAGSPPSPGVSEIFLATADHAALALGREFLTGTLRELAQGPLSGLSVSGSRLGVGFQATVDATTLQIELRAGTVRAVVDGSGSLSPGGSFGFRLTQDFALTVSGGNLALTLASDPSLSITRGNAFLRFVFGLFRGRIVDKIRTAASGVVGLANAELNRILDESVGALLAELNAPGVRLELTRAAVDPDAVIVGGVLDLGPTRPASASFTNQIPRPPGQPILQVEVKYDALESWIPGGTIESYRWSEVRGDGSVARRVRDDHRFVLQLPQVATTVALAWGWPPYTWCLEVRGTQFVDARDPVPVSGAVCGLSVVVPSLDLPRGAEVLAVEVPDGKGGTLADLDPWQRFRPHAFADDADKRGVLLVHNPGERPAEALEVLREVLAKGPERLVFPTVIVEGSGCAHACGAPLPTLAGFALTPDREGAWRRRFGLERAGSTVIVGPGGRELWRDGGPLSAEVLEKVLAGLDLEGTRSPRWAPVRLSVRPGVFAPEIFLPCGPQVVLAMSKLRGQPIELVFWASWSEASLEELRRGSEAGGGVQRFAVSDGEDPALAERVLKERGIEVPLVTDPEREIARRYGVSCWPTVVSVDADGRIAAARFGLEPDLADAADPEPVAY